MSRQYGSLDEWEAAISQHFYALRLQGGDPAFSASMHVLDLPFGVVLSELTLDRQHLKRGPELVSSRPSDDVLVLIKLAGTSRMRSGDSTFELTAGGAVFFDPRTPYEIAHLGRNHELVLTCPREIIGASFDPGDGAFVRKVPPTSAALHVLRGAAMGLLRGASNDDADDMAEVSRALVELVGAVARRDRRARPALSGSPREELGVVQRYILDHLRDPGLSVRAVAASHATSERHLTAIFAQHGSTPGVFIRESRLEQAARDLADPSQARRPIGEVARSWGFADATTFTRAFKRHLGVTPSEYRLTPPVRPDLTV